ncbi:MAG: hypothetical protein IKN96_03035 [Oscillibacter sp.]|nr:hypothetical protein [Oscillibacter sp.]
MKKKLLGALLAGAALILCACGAAPSDASKSLAGQEAAVLDDADAEAVGEAEQAQTPEDSEEAEIETEAGGADFAKLAGTWFSDDGAGVLTVYENGGFMLDGSDDFQEGYLVYTEEDGEMWESGPRYELFLENNERVPRAYFAFDDGAPGKLVYAVGGGAELFSRGDSAYDADGAIFRAQWADENASAYDAFVADDGEYARGIVFSTERILRDFKFLAISLEDVNEDGAGVFSVRELYAQDALTPERPLLIQTSFPGDMPTNGVCYTDNGGATRYFSVAESGYDGSLIVGEFERSETP